METTSFLELDCLELKNNSLELLITQSVGPRLIRLSLPGGENMLAELPDATLDTLAGEIMNVWGGHRLWHAPEVRRRTYLPDNRALTVNEITHGVEVIQPTENKSGIQKSMEITLPDQSATVIIDHRLKNEGLWSVELAPWAITQLKPGGVAILPHTTGKADPDGVLANRRLNLWPYTDINSPHIQWGNRFIFIRANMDTDAVKIGFPNPMGWIAYHLNDTLFVKQTTYQAQAEYFDFGSSTECYCRTEFIELETLGPKVLLAPGQSVTHRETWRLYPDVYFDDISESAAQQLVAELGL